MGARSPGWDAVRWRRIGDSETSAPSGSTEVLVDASDTTAGFLDGKVSAGAGLTRTIVNPGGNERVRLDVGPNADGSILVNADDVQVGVLATDGQHGNRGGGALHALATQGAAGFESAADKLLFDTIIASGVATWSLTGVRYYALDPVGGNDANLGYSDVSMAAAGAVAKRTWAGLSAILPRLGAGRVIVLAVKGPNNLAEDYDFRPVGYVNLHTVATTSFADDATDRVLSGAAIAAAGPNGDSSWTCVGGATTTLFSVAAGLSAGSYDGWRVRFTGNVTGALTNVCCGIFANTTTGITPMKALALAPAAGDTFLIERPGVVFNNFTVQADVREVTRGIGSLGAWNAIGKGSHRISFCESRAASSPALVDGNSAGDAQIIDSYSQISGAGAFVGAAFRSASGITARHLFLLIARAAATLGGGTQPLAIQDVPTGTWGDGCSHRNSFLEMLASGDSCARVVSDTNATNGFQLGQTTAGYQPMKVDACSGASPAAVIWVESSGTLVNTVITNTGSGLAAVAVDGVGCQVALRGVTGSAGNTGAGLTMAFAGGCRVVADAATTVTGTLGDVLYGAASGVSGTAIGAWAGLTLTNVSDPAGNIVTGTAGEIVGLAVPVTNKSGGALAVGQVVRGNGTTGQVVSASGNAATLTDSNILGVMVTAPANNAVGLMVPPRGAPYCLFDGAPTPGACAYLSPTTTGTLTTTVPVSAANNNRLRAGRVISASGSTGQVSMAPEQVGIVATGAA